MRFTILLIIAFCILVIAFVFQDKLYKIGFKDWRILLFLSSYYLLGILSFVLFTTDRHEGLKDLETKASFLVFPVFLYLYRSKLNIKNLDYILGSFVVANVIVAIHVWVLILNKGFFKIMESDNFYNPVFRKMFSETTNIHLPYLGLLFGFSCLILTHFLIKANNKKKLFLVVLIGLLLVSMFIFSARMAIAATAIATVFYLVSFLNKKAIIIVSASILVIFVMLSFLSPVKRRIQEIVDTELVKPNNSQNPSKVNFRYGIYYCSKEILKDHWLLGLGIGSVQNELNKCYEGFDYRSYDDFLVKNYNSHNQYLNAWMSYGVFGLLLILFYLGYSFMGASILHKSFIFIFTLALLTENLFEREIGVMLFAFFNTLFVLLKSKKL